MDNAKIVSGFCPLIQKLEGGALEAELSQRIADMVIENAKFADGQGKGKAVSKMTLELTFTQEIETVMIQAEVKTKLPKMNRRASMLFVTPIEHQLSLEHPMQNSMFSVHEGGARHREITDVNTTDGNSAANKA